jgi:hypothetical protein
MAKGVTLTGLDLSKHLHKFLCRADSIKNTFLPVKQIIIKVSFSRDICRLQKMTAGVNKPSMKGDQYADS